MSIAKLPSAGFSITVRLALSADAGAIGRLTTAVGESGANVTALDVVSSDHRRVVVDLTCDTADATHAKRVTGVLAEMPGVKVRKVSDRTFLLHLGGKIEVTPKVSLRNRDELSMAYTPGVARVCQAIAENPDDARRLTIKRNTVAVVTDGTAVLGLGNLGPEAALPVMEGKAALFKKFAGVDAWPVCLDTQDTDEIVDIVTAIAPAYGGINLEDIAAPRCFEIEARLRKRLNIPVFHDDQHGTAIVVLAALRNALRVVGKRLEDVRVTVSGAGAAGTAIMNLLVKAGAGDIIACDRSGALHRGMDGLSPAWRELTECTNKSNVTGTLAEAVAGSDVFIGVSAPNILTGADVAKMAKDPVVFALANPTPKSIRARLQSTRRSWPPDAAISPTRSTTSWRSRGCSGGCWTRRPQAGAMRLHSPQRMRSRPWSVRTRSIRLLSCRVFSTPMWRPPWRRRSRRSSNPNPTATEIRSEG